ncbi:MAG: baseplate J/gp47 family protein [Oxalobacter formigenes]|nr:baseplate J/gp47 family protein [Oxalobacter formigenes]
MSTYQTNVPAVSITETGISVPETQDILRGVLEDFNRAFGGNLNISSVSTPQYVLASEQAQAIALTNAAFAFVLSQFDPDTAIGRFQDALARIYFITRNPGTPTTVNALCTGIPGMTLPAGATARDTQDNIYVSTASATFDRLGQATVVFRNVENGAIPCPADSLVNIEYAINGWDAITNPEPGVTGTDVEGESAFEIRRQEIIEKNAIGTVGAIRGSVFALDGVTDCYVKDNYTDKVVYEGVTNYPLKPHSVYVAVVGGKDQEIATTIWNKKDLGCDMNGNTPITVYDDSALAAPYPEYTINFNRPNAIPILYAVTIKKDPLLPSDVVSLIQNAIMTAFNGGLEGFERERIAKTIYASSYYSVVSSVSNRINIESILIGTETANQTTITMGIDQAPVIQSSDISVILK